MRNDLGSAHRGYIYQDISTAYFMAECLANQTGLLTVDRKICSDDRFDDLSVKTSSGLVRRQFKRSDDPARPLKREDLATTNYSLRIDHLIQTFLAAGPDAAEEYRLCVTWVTPTDPDVLAILRPSSKSPSFPGHPSRLYELDIETLWPTGGQPIWQALKNAATITRQNLLDFAQRFVIELECPSASLDFTKPGALERNVLQLLSDRVGIGRYPNQSRDVETVADSLAWMASQARAEHRDVKLEDIEERLRLRKDYGREAQQFPVEQAQFVRRDEFFDGLRSVAAANKRIVLTGLPGSGKSWSLDRLAEELRRDGHFVARHYCYLDPGDERVQRRVTANVLFANLIAELVDASPDLRMVGRRTYSAGQEELEAILPHAVTASQTGQVYLMVDGVDHIARVLSDKRTLVASETSIVEELGALSLPEGVHLLIGSQPGQHLNAVLEGAAQAQVPDWEQGDIEQLVSRLGLTATLEPNGLADIQGPMTAALTERSDGNPLYATYLCKELKRQIESQVLVDPLSFLESAPPLAGDIANYYRHLMRTSDDTGDIVANLLGAIEFGVTERELQEILSQLAHRIPKAIAHLSPILRDVTGQGGIRVYHESFRRFVLEELEARGVPIAQVINPLIDWLTKRGFLDDAKAYRFLLPSLRRARRLQDVRSLIGPKFAAESIAAGHAPRAIEANLELAIDVAAESLDWPALAQYAHIQRAVETCFDEKFEAEDFGKTFAALFGASALAERLIFDGKPTWSVEAGTILCAMCDDAAASPPWNEYLSLPKPEEEDGRVANEDFEAARFQGVVRLTGIKALMPELVTYFHENPEETEYTRPVVRTVGRFGGPEALAELAAKIGSGKGVASFIDLTSARALREVGRTQDAAEAARRALGREVPPETAYELLLLGADASLMREHPSDPARWNIGVSGFRSYDEEPFNVRQWVASVGIAAILAPEELERARQQVAGEGWYRAWLAYVIDLAEAEAMAVLDMPTAERRMVEAFRALGQDTDPFKGTPRACDLFRLQPIIHETIGRGLKLLRQPATWDEAARLLISISSGTTTYLQNGQGGPLVPEALAELVMPYMVLPDLQEAILALLDEQVRQAERHGEYYEVHAAHELLLARALIAAGHREAALSHWQLAAQYMSAYGFHKDIAIFDLLESVPALISVDSGRTRYLLSQAQPLTDAVVEHTDGRETKHAPNYWYTALCQADPVGSIRLLGQSLLRRGGIISWILEDGFVAAVSTAGKEGNPELRFHLSCTQPFEGDDAGWRLEAVAELYEHDLALGSRAFGLLAAQVLGDSSKPVAEAYEQLRLFAESHGLELPPNRSELAVDTRNRPEPHAVSSVRREKKEAYEGVELFPSDAEPLLIMAWIRNQQKHHDEQEDFDRFLERFVGRLVALQNAGREEDVLRLVRYFAHTSRFSSRATPLAEIAERLEGHGFIHPASVAWTLAYARSRGGGGWLSLGGSEAHGWLKRAMALSSGHTFQELAQEVAFLLRGANIYGIARHLIELCADCGLGDEAFGAWQAAFEVLSFRLPLREESSKLFTPYNPDNTPAWSIDEALFSLLLARISHPELNRKIAALGGCAAVIQSKPDVAIAGFRNACNVDTPMSSLSLILQLLSCVEREPHAITRALIAELQRVARTDHFGCAWCAKLLLESVTSLTSMEAMPLAHELETDVSRVSARSSERAMEHLDWGGRIEMLIEIWPEFASILARSFDIEWSSGSVHKRRAQSRHRAARNTVRRSVPETQLLFWENEVFECVFHKAAMGITSWLRQQREWVPGVEYDLLGRLMPDLFAHVGNWYSRTSRPLSAVPSEQRPGSAPDVVLNDGTIYNGWYRCAHFEEELVLESGSLPGVSKNIRAVGGIVFTEAGTKDAEHLPLGIGVLDTWFVNCDLKQYENTAPFLGPLVGLTVVNDLVGRVPVFSLHPRLIALCGLGPCSWPDKLSLSDDQGEVAVVIRSWHDHPLGDDLDEETSRLKGCDLIMRPDVYYKVASASNVPAQYWTKIF